MRHERAAHDPWPSGRGIVAHLVVWTLVVLSLGCPGGAPDAGCAAPDFLIAPDPDAVRAHCRAQVDAECTRAFADCPDLFVYVVEYPDAIACRAEAPDDLCTGTERDQYAYVDDEAAAECLAAIPVAACGDFEAEDGLPVCLDVAVLAPPDPAYATVIDEGDVELALDVETNRFWGERVGLAALCLDEGDAARLDLAHAVLDAPRMVAFDPAGAELTHDLGGERIDIDAPVSGSYLVLVGERDRAPLVDRIDATLTIDA